MSILKLHKMTQGDHAFKGKSILGSMCTEPHYIAKWTFKKFLSTNIGDPGLVPNLVKIEKEYIESLGSLLHNNKTEGMLVSGGSEANILAMWSARELAEDGKREVLIPETCHFSFDKAANILGLKLIKIPVDASHRVRVDLVENSITNNTMAIVGIAGTTGSGACDPIDKLSEIAVKNNIYLHVDAAFGGFVFPFLNNPPQFDFKLEGVKSITMDPHKMGRSVIQAGCILYRNKEILNAVQIPVTYLSGGKTVQNTILGTRSGASIAAAWSVFNHLGIKGYKKGIDKLIKRTAWLVKEIDDIDGIDLIVKPEINIVGISSYGDVDIKELLSDLRIKGWALSEWNDYIRITVMPHVKKSYLKSFLKDVRVILCKYKEREFEKKKNTTNFSSSITGKYKRSIC